MEHIFSINNLWHEHDYDKLIQLGYLHFRINGIRVTSEACDVMKSVRNHYTGTNLYFDLPGNKCRIWTADKKRIEMKQNESILVRKLDDGKSLYVTGKTFWDNIKVGDVLRTRRIGKRSMEFKVENIEDNFLRGTVTKTGDVGFGYHIFNPYNYWLNAYITDDDLAQFEKVKYLNPVR